VFESGRQLQVFGVCFIEVDLKGLALKKFHVIIRNIKKIKNKKKKARTCHDQGQSKRVALDNSFSKKNKEIWSFSYIFINNP
jgi:hypothetical protein